MEQVKEKLSLNTNEEQNLENKKSRKKHKLSKWQTLTLYFFIFAFIGWLMETLYSLCNLGHFVKRGFLYGPICPIYGYGALILMIFFRRYRNKELKLFTYAAIVFSGFEYMVSYCLDALFSMHWWDYSDEFFNINGRICLSFSFAWGIIAILFINHIFPFLKKKVNLVLSKIPYKVQASVIGGLCAVYFVDTIASCVRYLNF